MTQLAATRCPVCRPSAFNRKEVPLPPSVLFGAQISAGWTGEDQPSQFLLMLGSGSPIRWTWEAGRPGPTQALYV